MPRRLLALCLLLFAVAAPAADDDTIHTPEGHAIPLRTFPAEGRLVLVWFACDQGIGPAEADTVARLNAAGVEVWFPDLLAARDLAPTPGNVDSLPDGDYAAVIDQALGTTGKDVALAGGSRAALGLLRGLSWWRDHLQSPVATGAPVGVLLFFPELQAAAPEPGAPPRFHPAVGAVGLPTVVFQPEKSPARWWVDEQAAALGAGGGAVTTRLLPGLRNRYYSRDDATRAEDEAARRLGDTVLDGLRALGALE